MEAAKSVRLVLTLLLMNLTLSRRGLAAITIREQAEALLAVWRGMQSESSDAVIKAWQPNMNPCLQTSPFDTICSPTGTARNSTQPSPVRYKIVSLGIRGQEIRGTLSPAIMNLTSLLSLTIRNTSLRGGLFPLSSLQKLAFLDLSYNNFSGSLPDNLLGSQDNLTSINLSHNQFQGPIPSSLVESVRFSNNLQLDLSGNMLSGPVPPGLNDSSRIILKPGNSGLCGTLGFVECPESTQASPTTDSPGATPPSKTPPTVAYIVVVVTIAALGFLATGAFWLRRRRRIKTDEKNPASDVPANSTAAAGILADGLIEFKYAELEQATSNFHFSKLLGSGGFGHVYLGHIHGIDVAVKVLNKAPAGSEPQAEAEYRMEIDVIGHVHHRNLVQLIGFCCDEEGHRILVYEYVSGGTLASKMRDGANLLSWEARLNIIEGTAKGLAYLHEECEPHIIHRDIKPANILLDNVLEPKIADFGLAKIVPSDAHDMTTRVLGTWGYVAPEYVSTERVGTSADVFSFGVVVLEVISGLSPHAHPELMELAEAALAREDVSAFADSKLDGQYSADDLVTVLRIALLCLDYNPGNRPTMGDVFKMITQRSAPCAPSENRLVRTGQGPGLKVHPSDSNKEPSPTSNSSIVTHT